MMIEIEKEDAPQDEVDAFIDSIKSFIYNSNIYIGFDLIYKPKSISVLLNKDE